MSDTKTTRILTLDLLRGYFLFVIIIDHLYRFPSIFQFLTGKGELWVSAAEGFFIISGILIGHLYGAKVLSSFPTVLSKLWQRSLKLYFWSVTLTLFFTALGLAINSPLLKYGIWTGSSLKNLLISTLTFRYNYGWADFLPYYVAFIFFSPFILYLTKKLTPLLPLALSLLLWTLRGQSFYLSWQVLFVTGLTLGCYLIPLEKKLSSLPARLKKGLTLSLVILSATSLLLSAALTFGEIYLNWRFPTTFSTTFFLQLKAVFDKATLGPGRLVLSWIWFATAYTLFRRFEGSIHARTQGFLHLLGQNSLFVYGLHALIIFPLSLVPFSSNFFVNTFFSALTLLCVYHFTKNKHLINRLKPKIEVPNTQSNRSLTQLPRLALAMLLGVFFS